MDKREKIVNQLVDLSDEQLIELWNYYVDGNRYYSGRIYENDSTFWDEDSDLCVYEAMEVASSGNIDLDHAFVKKDGNEFSTANDVIDLIDVDDLADYLVECWKNGRKDLLEEYDITVLISTTEIVETITVAISGLTHAIEDSVKGYNQSVVANLEEQVQRLKDLKAEVELVEQEEEMN